MIRLKSKATLHAHHCVEAKVKERRGRPSKAIRLTATTKSLNTERDRRPARLKAATVGLIEQTDVNRKRAFELRLPPHRLSYPAIARVLGVSVSTAYSYVKEEHGTLLQEIVEKKEHLRHLENETIDALMEKFLPIALNPQRVGVDLSLKATDRIIRLIEQKCRLNGLDLPPKVKTDSEERESDVWRREMCDAFARASKPNRTKIDRPTPELEAALSEIDQPVNKTAQTRPSLRPCAVGKIRLKLRPAPLQLMASRPQPTTVSPVVPPPRPDIVIVNRSCPPGT
jgi:predicted transcriptional regulator